MLKIENHDFSLGDNKILNIKNTKNNQLGFYLAGLIESDRSIIVPKENTKNTSSILSMKMINL